MRLLLAEDEKELANWLCRALKQNGYIVDWVDDGRLVESSVRQVKYDALILDLGLPGIDGHAVLARLREVDMRLPVLILTARDSLMERVSTLKKGADDFMAKPFSIDELEARLTALIRRPRRMVCISSRLHLGGDITLRDLAWTSRPWSGPQAYADSKLHNVLLAFAVARRWPDVLSNAVEPGWVATKMGGPGATDDLSLAPKTQVWLAASDDAAAKVSGGYFYHGKPHTVLEAARDASVQDRYIAECERLSGVARA